MDGRRKKPVDMQGVKRSRSAHSGKVTQMWEKLKSLEYEQPEEIRRLNTIEVKGYLKTLAKPEAGFLTSLSEAQDFAPTDEDELDTFQTEEDEAAEVFTNSLDRARNLGEQILGYKAISTSIRTFNVDLEALRESLSEEPETDNSSALARLRALVSTMREQWVKDELSPEHPLQEELDNCGRSLTTMERDVTAARIKSAPATTPITTTSISVAKDMEPKLPTIDVPTFNGDIMQWCSFWTSFESAINSKKMAKTTKLAYLRKAIKDPDSQTILYSPQEDPDFYDEVVASLQLRFNRTKEIHRKLVQTLIHLPTTKNTRMDLRKRVDDLRHLISSLKHTGHFDLQAVLTSMVYATMPQKLQTLWDQANKSTKKVSPIQELIAFMSDHAETLPASYPSSNERSSESTTKKFPHKKGNQEQAKNNVNVANPTPTPTSYKWDCLLCPAEKHPLYQCPKWGSYSLTQKTAHVTANKLCNNCLAGGHTTATCKSYYRCKECRQKHHTSLHQQQEQVPSVNHSSATSHQVPDALMTTAKLLLTGPDGSQLRARALIDSGAGISLITQRAAQMLNLSLEPAKFRLSVAQGETSKPLRHLTSLHIAPLHDKSTRMICKPAVATAVTSAIPSRPLPEVTDMPHLIGLPLADPTYNLPGRIDILLGADMASAISTLSGPRKGKPTEPMAQSTIFGWTLSGPIPGHQQEDTIPAYHQLPILQTEPTSEPQLEDLLKAVLQEQGEPGDAAPTTTKELHQQVEQHFLSTVLYSDHRYTVTLPRKETELRLGESRPQAVSRFLSNEKTNLRRGTYPPFQDGVDSYITSGHAEEVPPEEQLPLDHFYLPMHAVFKDSSTSTKLRVVFDGSAASTSGLSLNQALHIGPTIQATLSDTLLKFRSYPIALNADISKMYREVMLASQDRDLHRFVWRRHPSEQIKDYRMKRVTFGVSASPFLAVRTLHKIADDHGEGYPEATHHIKTSFYVDNFLGGAATPEDALQLFQQIRSILQKGGFQLRKWRSSSDVVIQQIPEDLLEKDPVKSSTSVDLQTHSKALGLVWDSLQDVMSPSIFVPSTIKPTKRGLVSAIYRTYDVLGWISPTVLLMKLMIQQLWQNGHGWDTEAPTASVKSYLQWKEDLSVLKERTLDRCYFKPGHLVKQATLHGFADASKTAYGAVVYYRATYEGYPTTTSLVTSKTKLAKTESSTIPRLELCAALLLAKLLSSIGKLLDIPPSHWHAWSDSSTVLAWLDGNHRHHPVYVNNRVEQTLNITTPYIWHYVPTAQNPADCASRGMKPKELLKHTLWWEGPPWLKQEPLPLPKQPPRRPLPDAGLPVYVVLQTSSVAEYISNRDLPYSNIITTAAWCRRYFTKLRRGRPDSDSGTTTLSCGERRAAELWLFQEAQRRLFPKDILALEKDKSLSRDSRIRMLTPFLDSQQILRVGGRLGRSQLSPSQKHPIILDSKDPLMEKYFLHIHKAKCHCGPSLLLCYTGVDLHILGARRLSRRICAKCVTCRKQRPQLEKQMMAELPAQRFQGEGTPFSHTGIDYAGPFDIKSGSIRKPVYSEAHICVFVCMATNLKLSVTRLLQLSKQHWTVSLLEEGAQSTYTQIMEATSLEPGTTWLDSTPSSRIRKAARRYRTI